MLRPDGEYCVWYGNVVLYSSIARINDLQYSAVAAVSRVITPLLLLLLLP